MFCPPGLSELTQYVKLDKTCPGTIVLPLNDRNFFKEPQGDYQECKSRILSTRQQKLKHQD